MNMIFADTMKRLREEKGLSRKDLEKQMYVTRSTIARCRDDSTAFRSFECRYKYTSLCRCKE